MKVAELTGSKLDYWVAKAANMVDVAIGGSRADPTCWAREIGFSAREYRPSSNWADGGPIFDRERVTLPENDFGRCVACIDSKQIGGVRYADAVQQEGPTPLIAAMRAYVASKFGGEVPEC